MIDIHTHILPGIDDGAQSWEETLQLCRTAANVGISHVVATPHFIPGAYTKGVKEGPQLLNVLQEKLTTEEILLEVFLAAEIEPFPELPQWLAEGHLPLLPSGKHVLIEAPIYSAPSWTEDLLADILAMGLTPIIAHPERSPLASTSIPENLVKEGGEIQMDAGSLLGLWGKEVQKSAWNMIHKGWVTYIASDSHRPGRRNPELLAKAKEAIERHKSSELAWALTSEKAKEVITARCNSDAQ